MPRNVVNNAILKDEFLSLLNATSTAEQRQKWHDANEDYRCDECIENSQLTCTPNTNKSIRCAFCQDNKVYCTRADAERRATVKELLDLDDRQFDAIRGALEREGRYKPKGSGYLPLKERRVARAEVTDIDPTEQCVIRVPVGFEEIIKQAQAESQARISSFDSAVDLPIALREDFASEMSKRSSIKDHAAWNGLNPGAIDRFARDVYLKVLAAPSKTRTVLTVFPAQKVNFAAQGNFPKLAHVQ
ncbi:hypothetical protein VKT23_008015 [Stygiomarasmius scandens]|uniref:Zn(2)-C6 fungal-type domain-containing protein n=1 Tax=Marasmiellus scandens TaxID=2682957 RepID=A0ABR1JK12_9AGAR